MTDPILGNPDDREPGRAEGKAMRSTELSATRFDPRWMTYMPAKEFDQHINDLRDRPQHQWMTGPVGFFIAAGVLLIIGVVLIVVWG